jgi:hypothetical protein
MAGLMWVEERNGETTPTGIGAGKQFWRGRKGVTMTINLEKRAERPAPK